MSFSCNINNEYRNLPFYSQLQSQLDSKGDGVKIRISLAYVETSVPSTVIPYVVQVFGALQWTNKPVIFAKIVQVLDTHTGVRLNEALKNIENSHLANFSL
ncbi:uncharacterized protein LOC112057582 isoform X3 [Bicyclus anynana]|uniref:Uncharacterized protein LOC112057582 isoform X3 n=1 Tax=Bicyclus anynana TaxID=110368 RepID=A0ABM3M7D7_BICAN|nr:uncharacterized protein LOC112057582 isoform X3 [Bicyclus anynana]